jgi:acetate kinase
VRVLVVNAGSSSLKLRVLGGDDAVLATHDLAPEDPWPDLPAVDAVGHRVVHGGERFREAVVLDEEVETALDALSLLAPLHQPGSLRGVGQGREALPDVPHVACFDTAFHASLPAAATTYAVPREWRERFGVRRGFHGLSHAHASRRAFELTGASRVVTCHLGAGASLAAVLDGRCVDTTMGFTPLEGLVMATRSGSVDPGMLLWLQDAAGLSPAEVGDALTHRSGLAGLAGTGDLRAVLLAADRGDPDAALAVAVYVRSLRAHAAAMVAALGGLDALVLTGGVGEHAPRIRAALADGLHHLGVSVDPDRNAAATSGAAGEADITGAGGTARVLVLPAREDLEIARQTRGLLPRSVPRSA